MSIFSSIVLPHLESELIKLEPQIQTFLLKQFKSFCAEAVEWAESKLNIDLNQDGQIGEPKDEA